MTSRRATLSDVARLAGVSLGSASRALSVPEQVKPATLESVRRAVEQLGYMRNGAAQALASRRTRMVAAIYPTINNPVYADSIQYLQQTLCDHGYRLMIASHEYKRVREIEVLRGIVERGVDGIVLVGTDHGDDVFELVRQYNIPYVLTWSVDETRYPHCVGFSNYDAAYQLAKRIIEHGHRRMALCTGATEGNERVRARVKGTLAAMQEAGIPFYPEWRVEVPFSFEGGREALRRLWDARDVAPSVIICGTDLQAVGLLDECRARGISVPEQLSVTGFDDIELAQLSMPPLTTVHVPAVAIGEQAARKIVSLIEGNTVETGAPLEAPVVLRGSLGDAPG